MASAVKTRHGWWTGTTDVNWHHCSASARRRQSQTGNQQCQQFHLKTKTQKTQKLNQLQHHPFQKDGAPWQFLPSVLHSIFSQKILRMQYELTFTNVRAMHWNKETVCYLFSKDDREPMNRKQPEGTLQATRGAGSWDPGFGTTHPTSLKTTSVWNPKSLSYWTVPWCSLACWNTLHFSLRQSSSDRLIFYASNLRYLKDD